MALHGADTEQLDDLGRALQEGRGRVDDLAGRLGTRIGAVTVSAWRGTDAAAFHADWRIVSQQLDHLAERLQHTGSAVKDQAREQDAASVSGASIFEPGGDGAADGWWGTLLSTGRGLHGAYTSVSSFFKNIGKSNEYFRNIGELRHLAEEFPAIAHMLSVDIGDSIANPATKYGGKLQNAIDWIGGKFSGLADSELMQRAGGLVDFLDNPAIKTAGRFLGGALSVVEIGTGMHQFFSAESSGWDRASGLLSAVSGGAGVVALAFPPLAPVAGTISAVTGVASAAIDIGTTVVENWDTITATGGQILQGAGDVLGNVGDAIGDGLASLF